MTEATTMTAENPTPRRSETTGPRLPRTTALLAGALLLTAGLAGCLSVGSSQPSNPEPETAGIPDADDSDPEPSPREEDSNSTDDNSTDEAATDTNETDEPTQAPSQATTFSTWGCSEAFGMTEVSKAWASRHTPEGFEPSTFFPATSDRTVKASFVANSAHCDKITIEEPDGGTTTLEDTNQMFYGVFVDPPDAYRRGDIKMYLSPFRVVTDTAEMTELLRSWDLPAEQGQVELTEHRDEDPRLWTITADSPNVETYRFDIQTTGEEQAWEEPDVLRFFGQAVNGSVSHAMDREVQPNTTQSPLLQGSSAFELVAADSPSPAIVPVLTNWKTTPTDKVAKHVRPASFE